ncbi:hypothetical protein GMDG_08978 [Pseudogymnoascus destructans 20631-21]|uniref:Enoyl-CoA hydratase n=1 Tax=Pseudogymnoascus destructans (strain ATCC MYA-4855 / 20631-21) TaxID=658429 RepID=L8FUB4_PSED2|nr:hypothetical protein GMDG_08978 [Pseudogymnoascus destructans 20631-21]
MLFTARSIDAATAAEPLITAAEVAAHGPQALRMAKTLLRQGRDMNFDQMLEMSAAMQALAHLTDDHLEGVTAVLEKRPADFTGR